MKNKEWEVVDRAGDKIRMADAGFRSQRDGDEAQLKL